MARVILVGVAIGSLLLLAACGGVKAPTSGPTAVPTATARIPASAPSPTATAGIPIRGCVRLNGPDGPSLANVQIYAKGGYGSTEGPAWLLATTGQDGSYWNGNAIPLMIVWPQLEGYVFEPESQEYLAQGRGANDSYDFVARPAP